MVKFLWIFEPDAVLVLPLITGALWALGGSGILNLRRIGVPLAIFLSTLNLPGFISGIILHFASRLPYGEKSRERFKDFYFYYVGLVGFLYAFSLLPLAVASGRYLYFIILCSVSGLSFGGLTFLSQRFDFPKWKIVEMVIGFILGIGALTYVN